MEDCDRRTLSWYFIFLPVPSLDWVYFHHINAVNAMF
jgi:hypothetical protein